MRLSAEKGHPDYNAELAQKAQVFLNGEELRYCVFADSDRGVAIVHRTNRHGNPVIRDGNVEREERRGNVHIYVPN